MSNQQPEQQLATRLINIYNMIIEESEQVLDSFPLDVENASRDNLIAFLSLKRNKNKNLDRELTDCGLTTLEHSKSHILYSLKKVLEHLGVTNPKSTQLKSLSPGVSRIIASQRSEKLFGSKNLLHQSNIMVTLDSEMVKRQGIIEKLLLNGIKIARINCAHGNGNL